MDHIRANYPDLLKEAILEKTTIAEFARQCGVSRIHMSYCANGHRNPSKKLRKIIQQKLGKNIPFV